MKRKLSAFDLKNFFQRQGLHNVERNLKNTLMETINQS